VRGAIHILARVFGPPETAVTDARGAGRAAGIV
jgi:hypothetical protein